MYAPQASDRGKNQNGGDGQVRARQGARSYWRRERIRSLGIFSNSEHTGIDCRARQICQVPRRIARWTGDLDLSSTPVCSRSGPRQTPARLRDRPTPSARGRRVARDRAASRGHPRNPYTGALRVQWWTRRGVFTPRSGFLQSRSKQRFQGESWRPQCMSCHRMSSTP